MKKMTKIILALLITLSLSAMTGCTKKGAEEEGYKNKKDFEENIQSKKKVIIDGKEMDEYTMKDGMKVQGEALDGNSDEDADSE